MQIVKIDGTLVPKIPYTDDVTGEKYRVWSDFLGRIRPGHEVLCVVNTKNVFLISDAGDFINIKTNYPKANFFSVPSDQIPK